jgi:predicted DNA-binding protein (MmcQ/YjbR family)
MRVCIRAPLLEVPATFVFSSPLGAAISCGRQPSTFGHRRSAMDIDSIRKYCLSFPNSTEKLQWGDDLCFKIGGKIFAMLGLDDPRLCFKCAPDVFAELVEREDIRPAPYVGRYKWVMMDRLDALRDDELQDLVQQSCKTSSEVQEAPHREGSDQATQVVKRLAPEQGPSPGSSVMKHLPSRGAGEHLRLH